jgi:hypothetical protein
VSNQRGWRSRITIMVLASVLLASMLVLVHRPNAPVVQSQTHGEILCPAQTSASDQIEVFCTAPGDVADGFPTPATADATA